MKNRLLFWIIGGIFYIIASLISKSFFLISIITLLGYLVDSLGYLVFFIEIFILPFQLIFLLFEVNFWLTYAIPFLLSLCTLFSLKEHSPQKWKYLKILLPNLFYWCFLSFRLNKRLHWKKWQKNIVILISPSVLGPIIGLVCGIILYFTESVFDNNKYYEYVTSYDNVRIYGKLIKNNADLKRVLNIDVPSCWGYGMVKAKSSRYYKIKLDKELTTSYIDKLKKLCERDEKRRWGENVTAEQTLEVESKPYWFCRMNDEDGFVEEYIYCIPNIDSVENDVYIIFSPYLNYIKIE